MKPLKTVVWILAVVGLAAGNAAAVITTFQEVTPNGEGKYEWGESNNWNNDIPSSNDEARIPDDLSCLINGQTAAASELIVGYSGTIDPNEIAVLTMTSGSLRVYYTGYDAFFIGGKTNGQFDLSGGTVTIDSTDALGGFLVGRPQWTGADPRPYPDGWLNMTGGTINAGTVVLGRNYYGGTTGYWNQSGGTFNGSSFFEVAWRGYVDSHGIATISGSAVFNLTGGTDEGLRIQEEGTFKVVGSTPIVDLGNNALYVGGKGTIEPNAILAFELDADGISPIVCYDMVVRANSILDLSADTNTPETAYTLVQSTSAFTQDDVNNFRYSSATDVNMWSDLRVYDDTGGSGYYEMRVDYGETPVYYTLTVNSGSGDGEYEATTVVDILADSPPVGDIFAVWTGDTAGIDDTSEPNTTITMPAAGAEITATYKDDPNTFSLTVNSGSGDGIYDPNTVVDILADDPGTGKIFDVWTGDMANIDDTSEPNTTIIMPAADAEITATYTDDPNYVPPARGYSPRACGFDMNRNGTIGEAADKNVGDGNTTDPDGDGTDEDLIYVDATDGNDNTGDGSPSNPYKTVQKALDVADGPGDGAEDIVCIAGTFQEQLTITKSGVTGYYTMDSFQFPNNPFMIVGWDKDDDGQYPPYDVDDTAVLDGNVGPNLKLAIRGDPNKVSYIEIAHLTIRDYGTTADGTAQGAIKLSRSGGPEVTHWYVHDVEHYRVNKAIDGDSSTIVWAFWSGSTKLANIAFINCKVDEFGGFGIRGAPHNGSGDYRFQNLTLITYGNENGAVTVSKIWDEHQDVEYLDSIIDGNPENWTIGNGTRGIAVRPCTWNTTVRNCEILNCRSGVAITPYSSGYCGSRKIDNLVIDRNIIRVTYTEWSASTPKGIDFEYGGTQATEAVEDVTITNNFISQIEEDGRGIVGYIGNDGGPQIGVITIAGNTIYGPGGGADTYRGISIYSSKPYSQNDFVVKNNIIANVGAGNRNVSVSGYEPNGWVANGNIYDADGNYLWYTTWCGTLSEWQTASGQDANSQEGDPLFVDAANGDLHIHPNDTLVEGAGVDITSITTVDIDGDARSSSTPWPGADVGVEANVPPNNPPVAADDAYSVDEDITLNVSEANGVLANDSDPNDDPITAELVSDVSNGTLTLYSNGSFDYTPNGDWNGVDSFVYKAYDGQDYSNDANAVITVNAVNDPPTAADDAYETDISTELNVDANNGVLDNDSDPESDPLTAILVTDVSNGTLTLYSTGAFDYMPDANYTGEDMFVYKANDSTADSGDANVVITVSAPTDDYASAESTDRGTVDGNYTDTYSSDDSYEALTEVVHANRSKLEHEWTFSVTGGTSVQFSVEAYKAGTEDDFKFEYSPNGSDWTYMLTVSKTSDDNTPQTFDLPGGTSGTFYIHVLDTNRDNKAKDLDTVYVDHMFIRSQ